MTERQIEKCLKVESILMNLYFELDEKSKERKRLDTILRKLYELMNL